MGPALQGGCHGHVSVREMVRKLVGGAVMEGAREIGRKALWKSLGKALLRDTVYNMFGDSQRITCGMR
jgi:hypothetical protein